MVTSQNFIHRLSSILMTCHYPLLGSASYWLKQSSLAAQPANQYGISAVVSQGRHFASVAVFLGLL